MNRLRFIVGLWCVSFLCGAALGKIRFVKKADLDHWEVLRSIGETHPFLGCVVAMLLAAMAWWLVFRLEIYAMNNSTGIPVRWSSWLFGTTYLSCFGFGTGEATSFLLLSITGSDISWFEVQYSISLVCFGICGILLSRYRNVGLFSETIPAGP